MERPNKLDNIQKIICSEVLSGYISTNLYDLFDENSLMIFDEQIMMLVIHHQFFREIKIKKMK